MKPTDPETLHAEQYAGTAADYARRARDAWRDDARLTAIDGNRESEAYIAEFHRRQKLDAARRYRIATLARQLRDPTNNALLTELLDLLAVSP